MNTATSLINSDRGDIAMRAGRDINILEEHDSFTSSNGQQSTKKRLFNKITTIKTDDYAGTFAYAGTSSVGSIVSGDAAMVNAGSWIEMENNYLNYEDAARKKLITVELSKDNVTPEKQNQLEKELLSLIMKNVESNQEVINACQGAASKSDACA